MTSTSTSTFVNSSSFPLRLILIGPPGCGKGTQAKNLQKDYKLVQISTGDLLRAAVRDKTELGLQAEKQMVGGGLVSDDIVNELLRVELLRIEQNKQGWILDGYPRTIQQAETLSRLLEATKQPLDYVFYIHVANEVVVNRVKDRFVHPASGRIYNLKFNPPRNAGVDDITGEPIIQREDDKAETVLKRLVEYAEKTKPVIDYYKEKDANLFRLIESPTSPIGYKFIQGYIELSLFSKGLIKD